MPSCRRLLAQITPQAIVTVIDEMLLMQRAKEMGLAVTDAQFTQVLESIRKDNKIESEEAFEAALKSEGMTLAQLKQMLSKRMLIGQVQQREIGGRDRCDRGRRARLLRLASLGVRDDAERDASRDSGERDGRSGEEGRRASARSTRHARRPRQSASASSRVSRSRRSPPRCRILRRRPTEGSSARSLAMK